MQSKENRDFFEFTSHRVQFDWRILPQEVSPLPSLLPPPSLHLPPPSQTSKQPLLLSRCRMSSHPSHKIRLGTLVCFCVAGWRNVYSRNFYMSLLSRRPRCMSMIWFSYNTSKSGDEQISMKETFGLCEGNAEQHLLQHCSQLSGW